jgi:TM2 domain-containing membrane protein YozV
MTSDAHGHPPPGPQDPSGEAADEQSGYSRYAIRPHPQEWAPLGAHTQQPPPEVAPKSPAMGVLLSVFIPGLGSMVNGKVGMGVTILTLNLLGWFLAFALIGIPIAIGTWIWGLVDGYLSAQQWNRARGIIS